MRDPSGPGVDVAFRADASTRIGAGHVMRCATLAAALAGRGLRTGFICRDLEGNLIDWLRTRGHDVFTLPSPAATARAEVDGYQGWLGVTQELEIAQSGTVLSAMSPPAWLVVDHYALDAVWEEAMRPLVRRVLCIDDLADRSHACDILLDQNYHANSEQRYAALLPPAAVTLLGPRYALLRGEFFRWRQDLAERDGDVRRILVFFGGSDEANVTATVLRALARPVPRSLHVDVVIGQANPHAGEVASLCRALGATLYRQIDNMAELMAHADLAIGATGVATWERAAVGLPAIAVSVADNQRDIARFAAQQGLLTWLGDAQGLDEAAWREAIDDACQNPAGLRAQSRAGRDLVDGLGAERVVESMYENQRRLQ